MPILQVTQQDGSVDELEFTPGWSLMEVLREAGYDEIQAMCGGCCSCATCHVHVANAQDERLPPIEEDEEMLLMLADNYDPARSRLSCQIPLTEQQDGLALQIVEID